MRVIDLLPTLGFLIIFPLWLRLIGNFIYRDSSWKLLAKYYKTDAHSGRYERIPRLVVGSTVINWCKVRKEGDFVILKIGLPFRLCAPHPPLRIPISRIKMKGRNKGTISVRGSGVSFEGFDLRKMS